MADSNALRKFEGRGADVSPEARPGWPKEAKPYLRSDPYGDRPVQQVPKIKVLVSSEHKGLTPIFGTSCPPSGLSGKIRELAFKLSEGRKGHWLLLLFADRVNVLEAQAGELLHGRLPNLFSEMGLKSEFKRHGLRSRFGKNRGDMKRYRLQALFAGSLAGFFIGKRALKRIRST